MDQPPVEFGENVQIAVVKYAITDPRFVSTCYRLGVDKGLFSSDAVANIYSLALQHYQDTGACAGPDQMVQLLADAFAENRPGFKGEDFGLFTNTLLSIINSNNISPDYLLNRLTKFTHIRIIDNLIDSLTHVREKRGWDSGRMVRMVESAITEIKSRTEEAVAESFLDEDREEGYGEVVCKTGIPNIDAQLGGGFKIGNFGVIVGYTSVGKSWSAIHLAKMTARLGYSALIIDLERPNITVRSRLKFSLTGMGPEERAQSRQRAQEIMELSLVRHSKIFLLNDEEKSMAVDRLPIILDNIENKWGVRPRMIIVDSPDDMAPPTTDSGKKSDNKIERLTSIYTYLKNFAKNSAENGVCVVATTQAQRKAEGVEWIRASNVGEDINKIRKATIGISLNQKPDEANKQLIRYYLFKNTDGPVGAKSWARTGYHLGQLFTTAEPYNAAIYREVKRLADQSKTRKSR